MNNTKVLSNIQVDGNRELSLKRICQGKFKKRIYPIITVISRISNIVHTKEKWKVKNMYQL